MIRKLIFTISLLLTGVATSCGGYDLAEMYLDDQSALALSAVLLNCQHATDVNRTEAQRDTASQVCEASILYFAADLDRERQD